MKIFDIIANKWGVENIALLHGEEVNVIIETFRQLGCEATSDIIALYSRFGGMEEMENAAYWRIWSLAEIIARNDTPSTFGILFSDHLMDSWCYRLKAEVGKRASVYIDYLENEKKPEKMFDSLEEMMIAYETNPSLILGGAK
jgi:hypothetical protein